MSYLPITEGQMIITEFYAVAGSVSNSAIKWNPATKKSTGSSEVSVNVSSGVITLPAGASYWLLVHPDFTRSSASHTIRCRFYRAGALLTAREGASNITVASSVTTANLLGQLVADVPNVPLEVEIREDTGVAKTANSTMSLIILEVRK